MGKGEKQTIETADVGKVEDVLGKHPTGIVTATGMASSGSKLLNSKVLEAAMSAAVEACLAEGITDPVKHREAMMAAREKVKADARAQAEADAAAAAKAREEEANAAPRRDNSERDE